MPLKHCVKKIVKGNIFWKLGNVVMLIKITWEYAKPINMKFKHKHKISNRWELGSHKKRNENAEKITRNSSNCVMKY